MSRWTRLAALAAALAGLATASGAETPSVEPTKVTPQTLAVGFAAAVPPEVARAQRDAAWALLDRDTTSAFLPSGAMTSWVDLDLGAEAAVEAVKVYGPASYWLTVYESTGGQWRMVPGLNNVALDTLGAGWTRLAAGSAVTTQNMRLEFRPRPVKGARQGLRELEVWAGGRLVPVAGGRHLRTLADAGLVPPHARVYAAAPAEVEPGTTRSTATVTLPYDPRTITRAYLAYDAFPVAAWVSAARAVNGLTLTGGFPTLTATNWVAQVEAIAPAALTAGENVLTFEAGAAGGYRVRNLRLLVELDGGASAVVVPATRAETGGYVPADPLFDGDVLTGVAPSGHTVEWRLDTPTEVEELRLFVTGSLKGEALLSALRGGVWAPATSGGSLALDTLAPGWSAVRVPRSLGAVEGLRLAFPTAGPTDPAGQVTEARLVGSPVGTPADHRTIRVAGPEEGEYYGRQAFLVGWLAPARVGAGMPTLSVDGKQVAGYPVKADGAFSVAVHRDAGPFAGQPDDTPWATTLTAVYPDGVEVTTTVPLTTNRLGRGAGPSSSLDGAAGATSAGVPTLATTRTPGPKKDPVCARQMVYPDEARTIRCKRVSLEVPAGAVDQPVEIVIEALAEADLTHLDPGMLNITADDAGYRFLPEGLTFRKPVRLAIPFEKGLLPTGQPDDSTATFYNQHPEPRWHGLKKLQHDGTHGLIVSETDHFTDMITATLVLPEHPTPLAYNPTSIKDLKAADPGARINLIEAPTANPMGDARLSYPIEVPPGRQGRQPQLAIAYSSSGGNGWLGLGWDLQVSSVSIDTRWGVPRYSPTHETETYSLDGEQLAPFAHRSAFVPRVQPRRTFHPRVEGAFRRIVRHGESPSTYWWEVTDKDGTRHFYGGTPESGRDIYAVLAQPAEGPIFRWMLKETRDLNGNRVTYRYDRVGDTGVPEGLEPGVQLYLQEIRYTGHNGTPGAYAVTFRRDDELTPGARRPDVTIDARAGFKVVTAQRLERIEVTYKEQLVRGYTLKYREGAFRKTLLESIAQFGDQGPQHVFHTHTFEYYDEVREANGSYRGFESLPWNAAGRDVGSQLPFEAGHPSLLGGTSSEPRGPATHLYLGINFSERTKTGSVGFKVGRQASRSEGLTALVDLNGDGLPDKLFKGDGGFRFRRNQSGPDGSAAFAGGDAPVVQDLQAISREESRTTTAGVENYIAVDALLDVSQTFTEARSYFTDANGDGLTDLVHNGTVWFGTVTANGPRFVTDSTLTPSPIQTGTVDPTDLLDRERLEQIARELERDFPLLDSVRRWVAPFDGTVTVTGPVALLEDTSEERGTYTKADGVRVSIQHNGVERWTTAIGPTDYAPKTPTNVASIPVTRGDRLYFRVHSVKDGAFDRVAWDPEIRYVSGPAAPTDANGRDQYRYRASADFVLAGRPLPVTMPFTGTLRLEGDLTKSAVTSDDLAIVVLRNGQPVIERPVARDLVGTVPFTADVTVTRDDLVEWRLRADSRIDLTRLAWVPRAHYTAADGVDRLFDLEGRPLITYEPPYDADIYPATDLVAPQGAYVAPKTGTLLVTPGLGVDPARVGDGRELVFTVKRPGALEAKRTITVRLAPGPDGEVIVDAGSLPIAVPVTEGETLLFDFSSRDTDAGLLVTSHPVTIRYQGDPVDPDDPDETGEAVPSALHFAGPTGAFAQPHRGWAVIGYQGNAPWGTAPIDEAVLVLDASYRPVDDNNNPRPVRFYLYTPQPAAARWGGIDGAAWIAAAQAASSRVGLDDVSVPTAEDFAGATAPSRLSRAEQIGLGAGIGFPIGNISFGASANGARGGSRGLVDYVDVNGDRYPDVLGQGRIQYTEPTGRLASSASIVDGWGGQIRESSDLSGNVGVNGGGTVPLTKPTARGTGGNRGGGSTAGGTPPDQPTEMPALGAGLGGSVTLGAGETESDADLMDVNGDGLPDRVFANGTVALNLGYRFAPAEQWFEGSAPAGPISEGNSLNASLGFTPSLNIDKYGFAGGLNLSRSTSETDVTLVDVNGDGLLDRVRPGTDGPSVALNTGAGFTAPTIWHGGFGAPPAESSSTSFGGGVYFTIPINIPLTTIWIIINPGFSLSDSLGRSERAIQDLDGDGFADQLQSSETGQLAVARNRTGRTNLLKSVSRPLGATMALTYDRSGNTYEQPHSTWVLAKVEVDDGHPGDGVDVLVSTFAYEDGFFDRHEREFYGYGRVTETRGDGSQVVRDFLNREYATKMLVAKVVERDKDGRLFLRADETYEVRPVDTNVDFPARIRSSQFFYEGFTTDEGQVGKATSQEFDYDQFGNVTLFVDRSDAGPDDDVYASFEYATDRLDPYLVGLPTVIRVRDTAGRLHRERQGQYDDKGNLVRLESTVVGGENPVYTLAYDAFGNLASLSWPNGYTVSYQYDPEVRTHIARIADAFGYVSTAEHNLTFGVLAANVDVAGNPTTYAYDGFARLVAVHGPYDVGTPVPTIRMTYEHTARPATAATFQKEENGGNTTLDSATFIDGLGRVVQTKKEADVERASGPAYGMTVSGKPVFDERSRVVQQGQPVFQVGYALGYFAEMPLRNPTETRYDIIGRPVATTLSDGATTSIRYDIAERLFRTTVTDPEENLRHTFRAIGDRIVAVDEVNAGRAYRTRYAYSILNEIAEVIDAKGNRTTVEYDTLGRRTAIDNADTGRTEYRYDPSDNLIAKVTANLRAAGQQITYVYEFNRLREIRYPETSEVTHEYGPPEAPDNQASRITRVTDETGSEERFYGKLGEVVKSVKTVASETGPKPEVYTTEMSFDSFGRMRQLVYPDGEVLTYTYDRGGLLERAIGEKRGNRYTYVQHLGYDEFGQRVRMVYGNRVETRYVYDPFRRWLVDLTTTSPGGATLQALTYRYDPVGNVLGTTNANPLTRFDQVTLGPVEQTYRYDDLYRLVEAAGRFEFAPGKVNRHSSLFTYDAIHNLTAKLQTHTIDQPSGTPVEQHETTYALRFTYGGSQPHAATADGERTYQYDPSGNLVRWDDDRSGQRRQLLWTEENRLREVSDNGRTTTFRYNAAGERVVKRGRFGETVWVNQFWTIRNAEVASKHVFAGETRVATQLVRQGGNPGRQPVSRRSSDGLQATTTAVSEPVLVAAAGEVPVPAGSLAVPTETPQLTVAQAALPAAKAAKLTGRDRAAEVPGRTKRADDSDGVEARAQGRPAWVGPHETRGIDRALEVGRGKQLGLQDRNGGGPGGTPGGGTGGGQGNGRGRTSPAIEGPYRPQEFQLFFYHADHLGSSNVITDAYAEVYEHVQYFPFGETWVDQGGTATLLPYKFTSKELDPETGLYYYGARYYEPRLSRWMSTEPALAVFLGTYEQDRGVFVPANLALYSYAINNPVRLRDYDGRDWRDIVRGVSGGWLDANTFGLAHQTYYTDAVTAASDARDYQIGYVVGSVGAQVQGIMEMIGGAGGDAGGLVLTGTGAGAVVGVPAMVVSTAVIVHGAGVATTGAVNTGEALRHVLFSQSAGGPGAGQGGGQGSGGRASSTSSQGPKEKQDPKRTVDLANLDKHATNSMRKRNWTANEIQEAVQQGNAFEAVDLTAGNASATRYVHPRTGKSVVVNDQTGKVIHVGGPGFKYD